MEGKWKCTHKAVTHIKLKMLMKFVLRHSFVKAVFFSFAKLETNGRPCLILEVPVDREKILNMTQLRTQKYKSKGKKPKILYDFA